MSAEDLFRDAWKTYEIERELDFSEDSESQELYGAEKVENFEVFEYPQQVDENGDPYTFQEIPLKLFAEKYRIELEDNSLNYEEKFELAIKRSEGLKDTEILEKTIDRLDQYA